MIQIQRHKNINTIIALEAKKGTIQINLSANVFK